MNFLGDKKVRNFFMNLVVEKVHNIIYVLDEGQSIYLYQLAMSKSVIFLFLFLPNNKI